MDIYKFNLTVFNLLVFLIILSVLFLWPIQEKTVLCKDGNGNIILPEQQCLSQERNIPIFLQCLSMMLVFSSLFLIINTIMS